MEISLVSWNLCGLGKLIRWPASASWLVDHNIILIQESLQVTKSYPFDNVTRFDYPATASAGRARGGLVVALKNEKFGNARSTVLVEEEYLYAVQVVIPSSLHSLVVVNVYAPVHSSGFSAHILKTIKTQLELLISQLPPTTDVIIAGNVPSFRPC
jgi:exonuclease III